jgi:hypothetical protein
MMSYSLKITLVFTALIVVAPCFGQTANPAKLKFSGIGLDSTYAQVVRAIGKPASEGKATREECIGGREKSVKYPGLTLYFMDGDSRGGKTFELKSFQITSPRWVVSGIKVGDTEAVVRTKIGRKYDASTDPDTGNPMWSYDMGDRDGPGTTNVVFRNGKVIEISSAYAVC